MTKTETKTIEQMVAERDALNKALQVERAKENKEKRKKATIKKFLKKQVDKIFSKYEGITIEEIDILFREEFKL